MLSWRPNDVPVPFARSMFPVKLIPGVSVPVMLTAAIEPAVPWARKILSVKRAFVTPLSSRARILFVPFERIVLVLTVTFEAPLKTSPMVFAPAVDPSMTSQSEMLMFEPPPTIPKTVSPPPVL